MGSSRVLYALSTDGLLPRIFATVNKGGSPIVAMAVSVPLSIGLALSGAFGLIFGLVGTLNTLCSVLVDVAFFALRRKEPDLPRPFRAIGYPLLPALVLVIDAALLVLFMSADRLGMEIAVVLVLLCIPFAMLARRNKKAPA
jgi:APA family basic amino acid/polyamine antiporter